MSVLSVPVWCGAGLGYATSFPHIRDHGGLLRWLVATSAWLSMTVCKLPGDNVLLVVKPCTFASTSVTFDCASGDNGQN